MVLPETRPDLMRLRPLGGAEDDATLIYLPLESTLQASIARPRLAGLRSPKRRRGLTRSNTLAAVLPDLLKRDFTAERTNQRWVGIPEQVTTAEGPVFLAVIEDLFSRRMLGFAQSDSYPTATRQLPDSRTRHCGDQYGCSGAGRRHHRRDIPHR